MRSNETIKQIVHIDCDCCLFVIFIYSKYLPTLFKIYLELDVLYFVKIVHCWEHDFNQMLLYGKMYPKFWRSQGTKDKTSEI